MKVGHKKNTIFLATVKNFFTNAVIMRFKKNEYLQWFVLSLFFVYQYVLRTYPGVLEHEIRDTFHFSANQFGLLGSLCMIAYGCLQIPLGFMLDKFGLKRIVLSSIAVCVIGNILFVHFNAKEITFVSRFLIGVGSACAFMSALKFASDSLPGKHRGLFMGLTLTLGCLGPYVSGEALSFLIKIYSWQNLVDCLSWLGVVLFVCSLYILTPGKSKVQEKKSDGSSSGRKSYWQLIRGGEIILYGVLSIGMYAPLAVVADLWGISFLKTKFGFDQMSAASINNMSFLGLVVGPVLIPWLFSAKKQMRGLQVCGLGMLFLFVVFIYGPNLPKFTLISIFFMLGIFSSGEILCFDLASRVTDARTSGFVMGLVNSMNTLALAFLHQIVGFGLDLRWSGLTSDDGVKIYKTDEFLWAFSLLVITLLVVTFLAFLNPFKKKAKCCAKQEIEPALELES